MQIPKFIDAEPISSDDVVVMNATQLSGARSAVICPQSGDGNHRRMVSNGHVGALVATVRGWVCPFCDHVQDA